MSLASFGRRGGDFGSTPVKRPTCDMAGCEREGRRYAARDEAGKAVGHVHLLCPECAEIVNREENRTL